MATTNRVQPTSRIARWRRKFACAARGLAVAARSESSFRVHLGMAAVVTALGAWVDLPAERWALLTLCIAVVIAAELLNTSIERVVRFITREESPQIRDALDAASAAVLVAAIGAAIVGLIVLGPPLWSAISGTT
jgi:diacylglycerol kinase